MTNSEVLKACNTEAAAYNAWREALNRYTDRDNRGQLAAVVAASKAHKEARRVVESMKQKYPTYFAPFSAEFPPALSEVL